MTQNDTLAEKTEMLNLECRRYLGDIELCFKIGADAARRALPANRNETEESESLRIASEIAAANARSELAKRHVTLSILGSFSEPRERMDLPAWEYLATCYAAIRAAGTAAAKIRGEDGTDRLFEDAIACQLQDMETEDSDEGRWLVTAKLMEAALDSFSKERLEEIRKLGGAPKRTRQGE